MSSTATEVRPLTLREGLDRIRATMYAMNEADRADAYMFLADKYGQRRRIARRYAEQVRDELAKLSVTGNAADHFPDLPLTAEDDPR